MLCSRRRAWLTCERSKFIGRRYIRLYTRWPSLPGELVRRYEVADHPLHDTAVTLEHGANALEIDAAPFDYTPSSSLQDTTIEF